MSKKNDSKKRLLAAIALNEKRKENLGDIGEGYQRRLAAIIAEELGIVEGKRYKVLPRPGNAYTVTVKSIGSVMPYRMKPSTKPEDLYISVLVHCERKNGHDVFRSEWLYTNRVEFFPVQEAPKAKAKEASASV